MTIALGIEGNSLRIVSASGKKVEKWDSVSFDPRFVKEGIITDTAQMAGVIKQALTERKLPTKNVRWTLPSIGSTSQLLTIPPSKANLELTVQREAKRVMSVSPETSYLFWQPLAESGKQLRVYAIAISKELLESLVQTCRAAGISIESLDLKSLALARAVNQKNAIVAHCEVNSIEMVIMLDSLPTLIRGIWLREKDSDVSKTTALLLQQLAATVSYYNDMNRTNPLPADVPIYLTGEMALNPELTARVSTVSGRTAAPLEPPVTYPPEFPVALYMANIGLVLKSS